jgi:hypothetical protein
MDETLQNGTTLSMNIFRSICFGPALIGGAQESH